MKISSPEFINFKHTDLLSDILKLDQHKSISH